MIANFFKSLIIIAFILCVLVAVYALFFQSRVMGWGASREEISMSMPGDQLAARISSTRAVDINEPAPQVWQWLVQLGADRSGFFSYHFLEQALGYESKNAIDIKPEYQSMPKGRIIPASSGSGKGALDGGMENGWPVVQVDPGHSFVLKGWGSFLLKQTGEDQSRLVVRTHGWDTPDLESKVYYHLMMLGHHIMERKMLLGIKARAEAGPGVELSITPDIVWLAATALCGLGLLYLVFVSRGALGFILCLVYGLLLMWILLLLDPEPWYPSGLLLLLIISILGYSGKKEPQRLTY